MSYRERQRLADVQAAIDAIRAHLQRGDLTDGLIFDAVRIRLLEIAKQSKHCPMTCLPPSHRSPGGRSPACATTSPTATSTPHTPSCRPPSMKTFPTSSRPSKT